MADVIPSKWISMYPDSSVLMTYLEYCFSDSIGLHRVENLSNINPAVTLHLYSPPYSSCHVFNELTGQSTLAKVTFWSKYGEKRDKVSFKILLTIKYKV